jgi:hypothetical protein
MISFTRILIAVIGLAAIATPAAMAFEPMPPIMITLLDIFPEKNGWFVDEALGVAPGTPDEAKPFLECFRVVVPDQESLDKAIARLMAHAPNLPIKKITRYDREPGAPGLAGFRGIWCQAEDESLVGFAILTINQNRFLLWAKQGYYPAFLIDTINAKVRDAYARDVSLYLAGIDAVVPENEPPQAAGRMLPEWMDLFPARMEPVLSTDAYRQHRESYSEIKAWGLSGIVAFVPTTATLDAMIAAARDTLWDNHEITFIQFDFRDYLGSGTVTRPIRAISDQNPDSVLHGTWVFAVDRYGRLRCAPAHAEDDAGIPHSLLFPGAPVLSAGQFTNLRFVPGGESTIAIITSDAPSYFLKPASTAEAGGFEEPSNSHLVSLGHLFRLLKGWNVRLTDTEIRKL